MTAVLLIIVCIICCLFFRRRRGKSTDNFSHHDASRANTEFAHDKPDNAEGTSPEDNRVPEITEEINKSSDYTKHSPRQSENEDIKTGILNNMELGVEYTMADMLVNFDCFPVDMTPYRLAALLAQLGFRGTNEIARTERNGKAYFTLNNKKQKELTSREIENKGIKDAILKNMKPGEMYTLADMLVSFDCFPADMTPHRLAALLSQLGSSGTREIKRSETRGKAYFCLPSTDISEQETLCNLENDEINNNSDQLSSRQTENELIKKGILINMESGVDYTLADMLVAFDCFPMDMTPHRLAALLSQLGEKGSGDVKRSERYAKAYFMLTKAGEQHRTEYRKDGTSDQLRKIIFETNQNSSSTGSNTHTSFLSQNPYSYSNTNSRSRKTEYFTDWDGRKYYFDKNGLKKYKQERVYLTDWDGRKYYYDKNGLKKFKQERVYLTDWDGREYYIDKNGEKRYKRESKKAVEKDPFEDAEHFNYYRNGITDHRTFVGTCKLCGIVWEFRSVEVRPVPYPHGTCPKCHQWVAVF